MTTYSEIEITFNEDLVAGATLGIDIEYPPFSPTTRAFDWVNSGSDPYEVIVLPPTPNVGEASAIAFASQFETALNNSGTYEVTRIVNVLTIKSFVAGINFSNPYATTNGITPANVVFNINNSGATPFQITSFVISEADTNPCQNLKVTVTTNELATNIINPPIGVNTNNPFVYEIARGNIGTVFRAENATGDLVEQYFNLSSILDSANMNIQLTTSPIGAIVTVNMVDTYNLDLEYSINDVDWQTSNVFNLVNGVYTMYVRDNLGCKISKGFTINLSQPQIAVFELPKANSIRYAQRITHGDCGNYKTDENTLSCEVDEKIAYKEIQQFQTCDSDIRTQFKSNFSTITAQIENLTDGGAPVPITINQVTNNLGRTDRRDAKIFAINPTQTGIYFTSGSIYDYISGVPTGETYVLNGRLPEWGKVGNYINVLSTWYVIENLYYDDSRSATVLVITNTYVGTDDVTINVYSEYNVENYEVYEYSIDFSGYTDKSLQVRLFNQDPNFTNLEHLSEEIQVKIRHSNTLDITYYSDRNTDIIYSTGIRHRIRLPYLKRKGSVELEIETNKTDTTAYVNESKNYELEIITFEPVTKEIYRKLIIALTQRILFIDGVSYRLNDDLETDEAIEDSNLYEITATLIKTANALSSNSSIGTFNTGTAEIPTLLEQSQSYLKY